MTNQQIKEQVGKHLFYMVASQMGCKVSEPNLDNGVDFLMMPVRVFENPDGSSRILDAADVVAIQLKCTTTKQIRETDKFIKFDLEAKNYNDLVRRSTMRNATLRPKVPLLLMLVIFNKEGQFLFEFNEKEITVKANIYFYYPNNEDELSTNNFTTRISIPKGNKLSFENFKKNIKTMMGADIMSFTDDMKYVKTKTIIAFLRSKGWTYGEKTFSSQRMIPPVEMRGSDDTYLAIPLEDFEKAEDYPMVINLVLNTISVLYDRKKEDLVKFFSKTIEEIKEENEVTSKMVELLE